MRNGNFFIAIIIISFCLLILPLVHGIGQSLQKKENESVTDPLSSANWIPIEFKEKHYDEWLVVKLALDIQLEGDGCVDCSRIDKLVLDYIAKKGIILPTDSLKRIQEIESICQSKFDVGGYDTSNMGNQIADGMMLVFDFYVSWLYEQEAVRALDRNHLIDLDKELYLYGKLNDALFDVCDSVAQCLDGSQAWMGWHQIKELYTCFETDTYKTILGDCYNKVKEIDSLLDVFDAACEQLEAEDAAGIVERFKMSFHDWYDYRKSVASGMQDGSFKRAYESITNHYGRTHLIHLKNKFNDIGPMSDYVSEHCLQYDCTDGELIGFDFNLD